MVALKKLKVIARKEVNMIHYDSKRGGKALTSCGEPITGGLQTVDWFDREQVNCPGCLQMLAKVETFFNEIFLPDDPERTCEIFKALGKITGTPN